MKKKYILAVQGEGRGHMTQALAVYEMLLAHGHTISAVIIGSSDRRKPPSYFVDKINCPLIELESPNFITDPDNKGINIPRTIVSNFARLKTFRKSLRRIDELIKEHEPDVVINFFDLLMGLYFRFYRPKQKLLCIAHQYIYCHPEFRFPDGHFLDRFAIKMYTRLTSMRAAKSLALSLYKIFKRGDVVVVPPLLRKELFDLRPTAEDFFLVYLVNDGYMQEVIEWHRQNPDTQLHCFTDRPDEIKSRYSFDAEKVNIHGLDDKLFLELMGKARGLASTAGFESVCEAMYLGKPVLMVPVKGHFEQYCNSRDASRAGAGIYSETFNLSALRDYSSSFDPANGSFRKWVMGAQTSIYQEIITT